MRNALKVLFVVAFAIPTMASAAISNTKHNLSSTGPGAVKFTDLGVDMCRFCHMPHNADTTQGALWARPPSVGATAAFTTPATTAAGTALPATNAGLGSASQKCLSCHDGTVALNTTVNKNGVYTQVAATPAPGANVTPVAGGNYTLSGSMVYSNLNGQHPVGIPFAGQGASAAVNAQYGTATSAGCQPGVPECVTGASAGGAYLKLFANGTAFQVECGTCHEPHMENVGGANPFFLRVPTSVPNGRCGGCHIK